MINKPKIFLNLFSLKNYKYIENAKKTINTIFFLKYILMISTISIFAYLAIPKFFDYKKRESNIQSLMLKKYDITVKKELPGVVYSIFPSPRLVIKNVNLNFGDGALIADVKKISILLKIDELYSSKEFKADQLLIEDSEILIDINNFTNFIKYVHSLKNKIYIKNSKITIQDKNVNLISFNKSKFTNKKNLKLISFINNKKINIFFSNLKKNQLVVEIPEMGFSTNILFSKKSRIENFEGNLRAKILSNKLQFDFKKKENFFIYNSFYRSKSLNTTLDGTIVFLPFFEFDLIFDIKSFKYKLIKARDILSTILLLKESNPNINGKFRINYDDSKYRYSYLEKVKIEGKIENSEINIKESLLKFNEGKLEIKGNLKKYEQFKIFNFNLNSNIKDKNKLLKKLKIKKHTNNNVVNLSIDGNLNLTSNKINFKKININEDYSAKESDIIFFKKKFENIVISETVFDVFNFAKITSFLREIL